MNNKKKTLFNGGTELVIAMGTIKLRMYYTTLLRVREATSNNDFNSVENCNHFAKYCSPQIFYSISSPFSSQLRSYIKVREYDMVAKDKGKVPPGCFSAEQVTGFFMP